MGYAAASRSRIEAYVICIRGLLAIGKATYQSRPQQVRWTDEAVRNRIPISLCAEGPKMLHLGGRIGDGVIAGTGLTLEVIQDTIARVHAGAREAGRNPADIDIWFTARTSLHEDREIAIENVKGSVSSILNHAMRFGLEGKHVPEESKTRSRRMWTAMCSTIMCWALGQNPKRMEALGLTDYAIKRWALAGDPRDWIRRIEDIALAGATKLWVSVGRGDIDRQMHYLRIFGEQIMPYFA